MSVPVFRSVLLLLLFLIRSVFLSNRRPLLSLSRRLPITRSPASQDYGDFGDGVHRPPPSVLGPAVVPTLCQVDAAAATVHCWRCSRRPAPLPLLLSAAALHLLAGAPLSNTAPYIIMQLRGRRRRRMAADKLTPETGRNLSSFSALASGQEAEQPSVKCV